MTAGSQQHTRSARHAPEHRNRSTVRRAVHESIYDVLDENTGYLDAWISAAGTDQDQDRIRKDMKLSCAIKRRCWPRFCAQLRRLGALAFLNRFGTSTSGTIPCRN